MKTLTRVAQIHEADLIRSLLETHGIQAFIPDEGMATTYQILGQTKSGIRVQVADEDYEAAKEIIEANHESDE